MRGPSRWARRVVGWAMGSAGNSELVGDALLMAFQRSPAELELDQSFSAAGSRYEMVLCPRFLHGVPVTA
jgi:transposase InsO family protein